MAQLRQFKEKFEQAGVHVVLVTMGTVEQAESFKQQFSLPFDIACDPKRELYQTYKIDFMTLANTLAPAVFVRGTSALARGHGIGYPHGDIRQLPAAFVINTSGMVTYSHYGKNPADHPTPEDILRAL